MSFYKLQYFLQEIKPVSDWDLLKLNGTEWPYIVVGSIAAFIQGACFPIFALLFGYTGGVSNIDMLRNVDLIFIIIIMVAIET